MQIHKAFLALLLAASTIPVFAWDGNVAGVPTTVDTAMNSGFDFRVTLGTGSTMCAGGPTWAYMNPTDANFQQMAAQIQIAKLRGAIVGLYMTKIGGYCHIEYITAP